MSQGTFSDTNSIRSFLKNICISSKNRLFLRGYSRVFVKNDQVLWSAFFTPLCP